MVDLAELRRVEQRAEHARALYNDLLAREQAPWDRSMRARLACPGCGGRSLVHATEVLDRADGPTRAKMALLQPRWWRSKGAGHFEAWICAGCGLVQWFIRDIGAVDVDGDKLRLVGVEHAPEDARAGQAPLGDDLAPAGEEAAEPRRRVGDVQRLTEALGSALERLRERVAAAPGRTMRQLRRCPACGSGDVLHATEVLDRADGGLRLAMALEQPSVMRSAGAGQFVAWICRGCGAVEWAVPDISGVTIDDDKRRLLVGEDRARAGDPPAWTAPLPAAPAALTADDGGEDDDDGALEHLLGALSRHVDRLDALASALARRLAPPAATAAWLSQQQRCPACDNDEVLHVSVVLDRAESGRADMALVQPRWFRLEGKGTFAAWICSACGVVEWRVPDIAEVPCDGEKLHRVEGTTDGPGPYR